MLLILLLQQRNSNDVTITAFVIRCDNVWYFRYIYVSFWLVIVMYFSLCHNYVVYLLNAVT